MAGQKEVFKSEKTCPFCKTELLLPLYMYRDFHCPYCGKNIGESNNYTRDAEDRRIKYKKSFRCEVLGWHAPTNIYVGWLSTTFESTCKRCGRPILQDSQGNWFSFSEEN